MTFYAYALRFVVVALALTLGIYNGHGIAPAAVTTAFFVAREPLMGFIGELDERHAVFAAVLLMGEALVSSALLAWACS